MAIAFVSRLYKIYDCTRGHAIVSLFCTWSNARKWNRVLANEIVANEFVVEHDKADQSHLRMVDVEFETLFEDRTIAFVRYSSSLLFYICDFVKITRGLFRTNLHERVPAQSMGMP